MATPGHAATVPPNAALIRQSVNAGQRGCESADAFFSVAVFF